jgi:large subunit ribosomal protein L32
MGRPPVRARALYQRSGSATLPRLMAVPKRKTSKARRDKRRATHAIEAPRVNTCPQCGSPKRAHRVCPTCGTYKGREVEPLRLQAP